MLVADGKFATKIFCHKLCGVALSETKHKLYMYRKARNELILTMLMMIRIFIIKK